MVKIKAEAIFLTSLLILLFFNFFYYMFNPLEATNLVLGAFTGLVLSGVTIILFGGIRAFGFGLADVSIRLIFGIAVLLNFLFQLQIAGMPIGIGLINTLFKVFNEQDLIGLGFIVSVILSVLTLASGLIMLLRGGGGE